MPKKMLKQFIADTKHTLTKKYKFKDDDKDRSKARKDPGKYVATSPILVAPDKPIRAYWESHKPRPPMPKISERMKAERRASQAKTQAHGRSKVRHN